ncbi:trypsin-like peptidase domain-containing protein [Pseudenhygromyxa sp. WMMC2535]|nr:trypsin-like peptidase domain-containing protein [Pseudenhygromyxa sp. WMMC2535]NVB37096.1 trypsin-like peptidase domain-containing protein [Pseudenhygromyxa sp. WMMC2535]
MTRPRAALAALLSSTALCLAACDTERPPAPDKDDPRATGSPAQPDQARAAAPPSAPSQDPAPEQGAPPSTQPRPSPRADAQPAQQPAPGQPGASTLVPSLSAGAAIEDERNSISVFEAAAPATVFITQSQLVRNRFTLRVDQIPAGTGSGFIWDARGHIVTNFHVVAGGDSFSVTLFDDRTVPARFVGGDPKRDIAVLALELDADAAAELTPVARPAKGQPLIVGQKTLAIGNPFGLDHTLTVGVISALDREVLGYGGVTIRNMIQTDASINPGNSGGPLLDSAGQLIGMNTMIYSKTGSSAGIGFAVPVDTITRLVPQIIEYGQPRRASLGIEVVPDRLAARAKIQGVIIEKVSPQGPAHQAGLQGLRRRGRDILLGDVIVGIDDYAVASFDDLFNALDNFEPGDSVAVKVQRAGEVFAIEAVLEVVSGD